MPLSVTARIPRPDPRGRSGLGTVPFDHGRVGYSTPRIAGRAKCTSGRRRVQELYRPHRDDSPWQPTGKGIWRGAAGPFPATGLSDALNDVVEASLACRRSSAAGRATIRTRRSDTPKQLGAVTARELMMTSIQTRIEPRSYFPAASVDPTDAHRAPALRTSASTPCQCLAIGDAERGRVSASRPHPGPPPSSSARPAAGPPGP